MNSIRIHLEHNRLDSAASEAAREGTISSRAVATTEPVDSAWDSHYLYLLASSVGDINFKGMNSVSNPILNLIP
jgi:hypothetical protein